MGSVFSTTSSNRSHHHEWQDRREGRLKEAVGALTGDDKLRAEGKTDQAIGKVKQIAEKAVDRVEQAVKKVRE
jgi:uncharacterized protein YjbJ (UPF0337 family)